MRVLFFLLFKSARGIEVRRLWTTLDDDGRLFYPTIIQKAKVVGLGSQKERDLGKKGGGAFSVIFISFCSPRVT